MARYPLMRLRANQDEAQPITEVNIIPVIDVSLVLLVILFVTAPLLSVPNTAVDMPHSDSPESKEDTLAVTYTMDGRISVMAEETDLGRLSTKLAVEIKRRPGNTVLLRVDKDVPYRMVQRLMTIAKEAGAKNIALGTVPYQ